MGGSTRRRSYPTVFGEIQRFRYGRELELFEENKVIHRLKVVQRLEVVHQLKGAVTIRAYTITPCMSFRNHHRRGARGRGVFDNGDSKKCLSGAGKICQNTVTLGENARK